MANLDAILRELQQERDRLDAAIEALASISANTLQTSRTGHTMSAAARRRIAAAQRARSANRVASTRRNHNHPKAQLDENLIVAHW
jgi:hypothetical protein